MKAFKKPVSWALIFLLTISPAIAEAQAIVQSLTGDVRANNAALAKDQHVAPGSTLTTGSGAQVILSFDDGQKVVLHENTEFKVVDFHYVANDPKSDHSVFDLLKGAARMITGALGQRSREAFAFRTPQATIGIRGTDFMVALTNQTFTSVTSGAIGVSNGAGTVTFGAGTVGSVASTTSLAVSIPASALPAGVSASFSSLSSAAAGAAGAGAAGGAGGAGASGAAFGGLTPAAVAAGAAAAAAVAGSVSSSSPTTGTTGTTGTR